MGIYVRNGTPLDGPNLCETCSYGFIRLGYRVGEETVLCRWTEPTSLVAFRVRACSGYQDKTRPNLYQMQQIAWTISPPRAKETAGFAVSNEKAAHTVELVLNEDE
jgi:hypothetical protein